MANAAFRPFHHFFSVVIGTSTALRALRVSTFTRAPTTPLPRITMSLRHCLAAIGRGLLGTSNHAILNSRWPIIEAVRTHETALQGLDDHTLRARSSALREHARKHGSLTPAARAEALAIVREVGDRRLGMWQAITGPHQLPTQTWGEAAPVVEAIRQRLATGDDPSEIDLPSTIYQRIREYAPDSTPPFRMRAHDVQVFGAVVLAEGNIAEMRTGEGKTLVAGCAAYLIALGGMPVHIVTVNDYLAQRDAEWNAPMLRFLGVSVAALQNPMDPSQRQAIYRHQIVYGTCTEFGFDYLRDNLAQSRDQQVQGRRGFAIIDEVDSILIDEARVPLIISGPGRDTASVCRQANEVALCLTAGRDFSVNRKERTISLSESGMDRAAQAFGVATMYAGEAMHLPHALDNALKAHHLHHRDREYLVHEGKVCIIDEHTGRVLDGRRWSDGLHQAVEAKEDVALQAENQTYATITLQNYFRLYERRAGMTGTAMTEASEFDAIYALPVVTIPPNKPVIRTDLPDIVVRTQAEKFATIIEQVSTIHALGQPVLVGTASVEVSERLSESFTRHGIPHRVLNARHHQREAEIVRQAGAFGAVTIATNMAGRGTDITCGAATLAQVVQHWIAHGLLPRARSAEPGADLWSAILAGWAARWAPTQVGSGMTPANLLLAINRRRAVLGLPALPEPSQFCTGVDVRSLGGLYVIGSERHESRRIDRQLCGRSGRQGDPGMTRFVLALDDDLLRRFVPDQSERLARTPGHGALSGRDHGVAVGQIARAQQRAEEYYSSQRKHLLGFDLVTNSQRQRIYTQRQAILDGSDVHTTVTECFHHAVDELVQDAAGEECRGLELAQRIAATIVREYGGPLLDPSKIPVWQDGNACVAQIRSLIEQELAQHHATVGDAYPAFLRAVTLQALDHHWMEHLNTLDHVRHGIGLEGYSQQDPHLRYKQEAFRLFKQMQVAIARGVARMALRHPKAYSPQAQFVSDGR